MVGVTPLWGLHLWIILAIGLPLKLDVPIAYLAANISIPPILPFITIAEVEIGSFVRTGAFVGMRRADLAARGIGSFLRDVWIGTAIFGPALAALGGAITWGLVALRRRARRPDSREPLERDPDPMNRVADRYAHGSVATRMYVSSKLHADPVGDALLSLGEERTLGRVLDLGCGRGQLAILLLEAGVASRIRGVDWDQPKIDEAARASQGLDADFARGDVRSAAADVETQVHDTALLIDVLHYFAEGEQSALVRDAARAARERVIIRDIDPDRGFRSTMTRLQERLTTGASYNRGERVLVRSIATITRELEAEGFGVAVTPCWGKTPFSNVLIVATRIAR